MSEISVTIDTLGTAGDGIVRTGDKPLFIAGALPGETVTAKTGKDVTRADLISITNPSPQRQVPPCQHFNNCGGCVAQHMDETLYHAWKQDGVQTTISRHLPAPDMWHPPVFVPDRTRRRVTLAALRVSKSECKLGFHPKRGSAIVPIQDCIIMHPDMQRFIIAANPFLTAILTYQKPADIQVQMADNGYDILITGPVGAKGKPDMDVHHAVMDLAAAMPDMARIAWRAKERERTEILLAPKTPIIRFDDLAVAFPIGAFLQPSQMGEAALRNAIQEAIKTHAPSAAKALDLFCGCGTLTPALLSAPFVQAYDSDAGAVNALQFASGGFPRLHIAQRDLFRQPLSAKELSEFDVVVLDPARAGALDQCLTLAKSSVKLVIYVSCNPASFARDTEMLINAGYRFASAQLVDQFTYSPHSEVVGVFVHT